MHKINQPISCNDDWLWTCSAMGNFRPCTRWIASVPCAGHLLRIRSQLCTIPSRFSIQATGSASNGAYRWRIFGNIEWFIIEIVIIIIRYHTCTATHTHNNERWTNSSTGMTYWLTTNHRHGNERLTVFSAAYNKRRHFCPGHRCFKNSSLISLAWAGQPYLSSSFIDET